MQRFPLNNWSAGQPLAAAHLQEAVSGLRGVMDLLGFAGTGPGPRGLEYWIGVITDTGPTGESDYADERYWVVRQFIQGGAQTAGMSLQDNAPVGDDTSPYIFTATNLAEYTANTHALNTKIDVPVLVFAFFDGGDANGDQQKHYVFYSTLTPVKVKITGTSTFESQSLGGGKYSGVVWNAPTATTLPVTGTLSEADLGASGASCLIYNTREVGKTTHDLATSAFLPLIFNGTVIGVTAGGAPVVAIEAQQWEDCS